MINNLLISFTETLGVGAIGLVLGMLIVFLGITVLVLMIKLLGAVLDKSKNDKNQSATDKSSTQPTEQPIMTEEGVTDEVKAAIVAAISAYYFGENTKTCEFKVKKIKKY